MALLSTTAASLPPQIVTSGYQPQDADERGLWMQVDEYVQQIKTSNSSFATQYSTPMCGRYFVKRWVRSSAKLLIATSFARHISNTSMASNGIMQVWSGLFLRTRNEAQLAAVLGHEYTHCRARHSLNGLRDAKTKTNAIGFPIGGWSAAGAVTAAQCGVVGSLFAYSREMEREADAGSLPMLVKRRI